MESSISDGRRSPSCGRLSKSVRRWYEDFIKPCSSRALSASYGLSTGGFLSKSSRWQTVVSLSFCTVRSNFVWEEVIFEILNWASTWSSQASALCGQKSGSFGVTAAMSPVSGVSLMSSAYWSGLTSAMVSGKNFKDSSILEVKGSEKLN